MAKNNFVVEAAFKDLFIKNILMLQIQKMPLLFL